MSTFCSGSRVICNSLQPLWWLVDSPHKGPVMWKVFPCHDIIMPDKKCMYPDWRDCLHYSMITTKPTCDICLHQLIGTEWCIYASVNYTIIASDNGLLPVWHQAIIWTNVGLLLIVPFGTYFSEMMENFSFKKTNLKMLAAKWRPFCLSHNMLTSDTHYDNP